jgi:polyphosphate kinase 2 (PPK2 family)
MNYRKRFVVEPGARVRLGKIDPGFKGHHESQDRATPEIQMHIERLAKLQYLLYADGNHSLLVVLQALDAGGKDGMIRHVFSAMNPQGTSVAGFKEFRRSRAKGSRRFESLPLRHRVCPVTVPPWTSEPAPAPAKSAATQPARHSTN